MGENFQIKVLPESVYHMFPSEAYPIPHIIDFSCACHNGFAYSVKFFVKGSNFAIFPVFVSVNQTFPLGSVVIPNGCVHAVEILYSVMYPLDFASPLSQ